MRFTRKNSTQEIKQETAINSGQMKSLVSDLLVWGSKHSTERRQDEPSRPPTAYNLRKTEDGVSPMDTHTHKTPATQNAAHISGLWKSLFNLGTLKQMV